MKLPENGLLNNSHSPRVNNNGVLLNNSHSPRVINVPNSGGSFPVAVRSPAPVPVPVVPNQSMVDDKKDEKKKKKQKLFGE